MTFEPQKQIGKYAIVREIGAGATSRVYLARDPFAERDVAIKVFLFEEHADPVAERMAHKAFLTESSLAGKLNHPHIVDIYDAVIEPHYSYLVMEYVPGVTLEAHRSEEHTSELQSLAYLVCRLLLEKKKKHIITNTAGISKHTTREITVQHHYAVPEQ